MAWSWERVVTRFQRCAWGTAPSCVSGSIRVYLFEAYSGNLRARNGPDEICTDVGDTRTLTRPILCTPEVKCRALTGGADPGPAHR
eukprot:4454376-Prymnesium_polylepis.1